VFVSNIVRENEPQLVRKIYDKAKEYENVTDLTLGDPDIPTPQEIKDAANAALENNRTKYTANAGLVELREAISKDVFRRTGIVYANDEIAVTAGAMGALYLSSAAILDPSDEMIILEPHWPNYTNMVKMCNAVPKYVNYLGDENIKNLTQNIEKEITEKTKAIIINSPSNPTGILLSFESLVEIAGLAKKYNLWVVTDEVYHTIVFDGKFRSILEIPGMKERTILIDSLSKRFSMTGFRVGFVCAPKEIATAVATLQENVNSCACMFAQYASVCALENSEILEKSICETFRKRCTAMISVLKKSKTLVVPDAVSTFYLFIDITGTGLTSEEFAYKLLEEKHIAVVPGNAFNRAGEGYIRIACTLSEIKLIEAAEQIVAFADGQGSNNFYDGIAKLSLADIDGKKKGNMLSGKAMTYIAEHYRDTVTLSSVAQACEVSKEHLSRTFRKEVGLGFNQYLNLYRIKKADELLRERPDLRIIDVALCCGFGDSNYFSTIYKQVFGVSPKQEQKRKE